MIEREDGPIKHYRMVCDLCGKRTKRFAYNFKFEYNALAGWKEVEGKDYKRTFKYSHHCPKCSLNVVENVKEVITY